MSLKTFDKTEEACLLDYASEVGTTVVSNESYVAAPGSEIEMESKLRITKFEVRIGDSKLKKTLWCRGRRPQNELLIYPDIVLPDSISGHVNENAITGISSQDIPTFFEAIISECNATSNTAAVKVSYGSSELGRRLREIRKRIEASGERLLDWDEIDCELRDRRGEWKAEDK